MPNVATVQHRERRDRAAPDTIARDAPSDLGGARGAPRQLADLRATGFTLGLSLEQPALGRLATVRLLPPGEPEEGIVVDLLFASSGIEPEICRDAVRLEIAAGLVVPVAQAGHLLVMKILARAPDRVQDEVDARMLVRDLSDEDRARARKAAARVETLGANRGKPIRDELERLLASE